MKQCHSTRIYMISG